MDRLRELQDADYDPDEERRVSIEIRTPQETAPEIEEAKKDYAWVRKQIKAVRQRDETIQDLVARVKVEHRTSIQGEIMDDLRENQDEVMQIASVTKKRLRKMAELTKQYEKKHPSSSSAMLLKNMLSDYSRKFQQAVTDYREHNEHFDKELREKIVRQAKIINPKVTDTEIDEVMRSDNPHDILVQRFANSSMNSRMVGRVAEIEEQHEQCKLIERNMRQIQELFEDLALLVQVQGEQLDRIDLNISATKTYTEQAVVHIQEAERHQISANKKKLILLGIVMCLVVLVAIIIATQVKVG